MSTQDSPSLTDQGAFWRTEIASRASVIIDADDYFTALRSSMLKARCRIMLVGWDFDARIRFASNEHDGGPATIGRFISWLARRNAELQIHVLRWDTGAIKSMFQANTLMTLLRWIKDPQIHIKLDGHHPFTGAHHQKIVVIDDEVAFCGGIDITRGRWDTRDHKSEEPRRRDPDGTHYGPWHDATTALQGAAARALGDMCRARWEAAGGAALDPVESAVDCWPDGLAAQFADVPVGIARTLPQMDDHDGIHEVEALYLALIKRAKRWIYAESQYFASRHVAEAIAARLHESDGPEIVVVNPTTAEGWLEPVAMDTARARLVAALRECDAHRRFRLYHPFTANGEPIYVHAKLMIVDDEMIRVGSSNFNNRSLRLDSECDVMIDATRAGSTEQRRTIAGIRTSLLAEHLGCEPGEVEDALERTGSLIATISDLQTAGRSLREFEPSDLNALEEWLADNKLLDPEGPDEMFEPLSQRPGLLSRFRHRRR
ncbi:phospholipase D/transphosphatidylase [Pseudorhodoferax aquiterrae]|uniref:Phospholipase D/transphosphatidylase n=1 Tax=Pseudorhodoferax aquiterrae TaxID=747304 RepID=A0ABQ3G669_9BURK|nr:phospholipase D-like domain-containing protein [Pseudorhodoferax aquiterrae]GHC92919.1 phospholipase D/transphosphatidylase [Pseudorhodoferax aquiterrae]